MPIYRERFQKVLEYIDSHLSENPDVETLSRVAELSKYHFHRQFSALYGIGVAAYRKQLLLKQASYQLAFRQHMKVIDIALLNGYESPEAFSRAFSSAVGQSPTVFRKDPDWIAWHQTQKPLNELRNKIMNEKSPAYDVRIVDFPATTIAVLEHRGAPELLGNSIRNFISWRKQNGLTPAKGRTFNLVYDDHTVTPPNDYRLDLAVSVNGKVAENNHGIIQKAIPAGRCAVVRHIGSDETIGTPVNYLYAEWINKNNEQLGDFPLFFERISFFPDVPEHEMITDIYLPLG